MQVEKATLQFLKEIEMLSDTEGRYIFYLAKQFTDKKKRMHAGNQSNYA